MSRGPRIVSGTLVSGLRFGALGVQGLVDSMVSVLIVSFRDGVVRLKISWGPN